MNWKEKRELKNRTRPFLGPERWKNGLPPEMATEIVCDLLSAFAVEHTTKTTGRRLVPGGLRELSMTMKLVEVFGQRYALGGSVFNGALYEINGRGRQVMYVSRGVLYRIDNKYQRHPLGSFQAGDVRFVLPWKSSPTGASS